MGKKDKTISSEENHVPRFLTESTEESLTRFYKRFGTLVLVKEDDLDDRLKEWRKVVPDINNMTEAQWQMLCEILDEIQEENSMFDNQV